MSEIIIPLRNKIIAELVIFCQIKPLARPRTRQYVHGIYQPLENQQELRAALTAYEATNITEPVIIDSYINFAKSKKSKFEHPTGRNHGDEDNLRKAICDALVSAGIINDDSLIVGGQNYKAFGDEDLCFIQIYNVDGKGRMDVISA